ncbi:FkbM family methyltransferase [Natronorubrum aibiense]|uniref:FkbM family methyltransferase n=1 Tax=Natronorubrum aibiense TaxID=348826 RepID=A0A5P9P4F7_9EURY|nr:FkbM family methyltransferase [Natronorubrum aibiense]QFU83039.1 FkbM family methyltransferase [Natronorubrum aibiense]
MTATRTPVKQLRSAVGDPSRVARYLRLEGRKLGRLLRAGRLGAAAGSATELLTGRNPYYEHRLEAGRYQVVDVGGHELVVDTADAGISRTLLAYGVHEYRSTAVFERELERLAEVVDGPVHVLEIGANIGYFCTLEASVLGERARIHAIEPVPSNVDLLAHNLERNGYAALATVEQFALGNTVGTVEMELSTHSNQHCVRDTSSARTTRRDDHETVSVEQTTGNRYLAERAIDPESVAVVRFDVEGYERDVLAELTDVLEASGPTLVYVEVHPLELSVDAKTELVDRFETHGFEVVSAVRTDAAAGVPDGRRWHGLECDVDGFDDLRRAMTESDHSIELIVRK